MKKFFKSNKRVGCNKLKPSNVLQPTLKHKISIYKNRNPSSLNYEDFTSTTISEPKTTHHDDYNNNCILKHSTKLIDSIAVEKDSQDPREDFRNSILQMILERKIYSEEDLEELLECFLQLNANCHHQIIVQSFMEICEEIFPKKT